MSTLPLVLRLAEDLGNLSTGFDDCLGFYPHRRFYRPALQLFPSEGLFERQLSTRPSNDALMNVGKDGFQVCMDVQQFKPSEITVKTVDNAVVIEGKHEEREDDHGYISRHFVRRYTLPKGYDSNSVVSTLSSDGVLTVKAPPPPKSSDSNERLIQIQHTGPAHLSVKENPKDEKIQK